KHIRSRTTSTLPGSVSLLPAISTNSLPLAERLSSNPGLRRQLVWRVRMLTSLSRLRFDSLLSSGKAIRTRVALPFDGSSRMCARAIQTERTFELSSPGYFLRSRDENGLLCGTGRLSLCYAGERLRH
ncbi:hypothetical protein E4U25_001717, partial [Claviceps purpurea]